MYINSVVEGLSGSPFPGAEINPHPPLAERSWMLGDKVLLIRRGGNTNKESLARLLGPFGLQLEVAEGGREALRRLGHQVFPLVLLELGSSPQGSLGLLAKILKRWPDLTVLVIAEEGNPAAQALRKGAFGSMSQPLRRSELEIWFWRALERSRLLSENAALRQENYRDDLTSAHNRRYLDRILEEELERSRRYGHPFSILFLDLDHLRFVNDAYGHLAGSRVLIEVADVIRKNLRRVDQVFRFGGDEFVATLPETERRGAYRVASRLRRAIKEHPFLVEEGKEVSLTASIGIATYPEDGDNGEGLLRRADEAMYLVKETTRDGVAARKG